MTSTPASRHRSRMADGQQWSVMKVSTIEMWAMRTGAVRSNLLE